MVYNTKNCLVSRLSALSEILNSREHNVSETGPVFAVSLVP
jgi:hypothetical protein